jgi:hypothetical protein
MAKRDALMVTRKVDAMRRKLKAQMQRRVSASQVAPAKVTAEFAENLETRIRIMRALLDSQEPLRADWDYETAYFIHMCISTAVYCIVYYTHMLPAAPYHTQHMCAFNKYLYMCIPALRDMRAGS